MDVVASLTTLLQKEGLREAEGSLPVTVDEEAARDEHEDSIIN